MSDFMVIFTIDLTIKHKTMGHFSNNLRNNMRQNNLRKMSTSNGMTNSMMIHQGVSEMDELIRNDEKPTFKIKVTFKSGEAYDLMFYHELKSGVKHSDVVKWAMKGLVKTIYHPENIVDARFIMG